MFSGPGGSENQSKIGPESLLALNLAPRASWRPLGLDFRIRKQAAISSVFKRFLKQGAHGPAGRGRPQWEGTFGESTYGRRWASPKLCLSQCFRDLQFASLTASSEPEGSVAGSPVGLRPQTAHGAFNVMRIGPTAVAKDPLGNDFEECFRSCGGARASFEKDG